MARAMETPSRARLTHKAFWKHLPLAKLCQELQAPQTISFRQVEKLLRCAYEARGLPYPYNARSIEREYKGFMKLNSDEPVKAVLPRLLDGLQLPRILATK